ncbi:unnamed protein product [Pelagomonas calceolata]|uniref:Dual specificity phosphatase catalytic domain-containing protein n=1 Tax=Pelagomonas calceolata TaxID=35677 RepID=A0A8J2T159_9STRA|nr:unnamed protein product [Pelagomonas calceolata]
MGKKPPPETPEEKAARKQAEAARFGQGNQIESLVEAAGCSCKGLRLRDAIKSAILGEIPEFFEKDEERLMRPVRAQLPAWDPKDKTRRMLDDYSEIVSELRREEINQDRANTLRVAGHVQKLIKGPGPPSVRKVDLIKRHARGEGLTVPEYLSEKKREDSKKIVRKRFKLKELGRRITAEANDPRPSRGRCVLGRGRILSRLGSRAKALAAKRLKKAKRKGLRAMVLSELVYCSHLFVYCASAWRGSKARQNILYEEYCMAAAFIKDALELGGRVLVTCATGYDSSACALLAYLIKVREMPLAPAYKVLKVQEPLLELSRSNTLFITLFEIECYKATSIRKHKDLATPVFTLVRQYVPWEQPGGLGSYYAFGNVQMASMREFAFGRAPLVEPRNPAAPKKRLAIHKAVYHGVKAIYMKVRTGLKGYQEATTTAICTGPLERRERRRAAKRRITHYDATRDDPPRPWPRTPREATLGAQGALVRPPSAGDGKARPRSAAAVFPDMDVGWQGVPRLSRPPTLWTAPEQKAKPLVRPPSRPGSRRKKARPASAPAGRRRRRAKVQLLEPLPTVPQDAAASIEDRVDGLVAVQLPPLAESSESFPPTPQLSARPATAGGRSAEASMASDSLLSWQPGLFLQPSLEESLASLASEESANYWAKRRSSRDDKTEGELCAAIARRDHDAFEMGK